MEILKGRPLCIIITVCLLLIAGCAFTPVAIGIIVPIIAAGCLLIAGFLVHKRVLKVKHLVILTAAVLFITASGIRGHLYFNKGKMALEEFYGCQVNAEVTVTEKIYSSVYGSALKINVERIGDRKINCPAFLQCEYDTDFTSGDVLQINVNVFSNDILLEDGTYTYTSLLSEGIFAYCRSYEDDATLILKKKSIWSDLERINNAICVEYLHYLGDRAGGLASALALGNQNYVEDSVERDFSRTGLAHILALSGSHIVLIMGAADALLLKYWINRKVRSIIIILAVPLYVAFVMTPIPALRAGIMFMLMMLSYCIGGNSDAIVNLFMSALIIAFISPAYIFSPSLWMSFLATLTLIVFMPPFSYLLSVTRSKLKVKWFFDIARAVTIAAVASVLGSLSNIIFSYALFGTFSTLTVITNVIFGPILTLLLILYMLMIPVIYIEPMARLIAVPIRFLSEAVLDCIEALSDIKYSVVSLRSDFAGIICVMLFVLMIGFFVFKIKRKWLVLVPVLTLLSCFTVLYCNFCTDDTITVTYAVRGMNEEAVVKHGDDFTVIDAGDGRYTNIAFAIDEACDQGACEIKAIILTHYHSYHSYALRRTFDRNIVRYLVLPEAVDGDDRGVMIDLLELCKEKGVTPVFAYDNSYVEISDSVLYNRRDIEDISRSSHPVFSYELVIYGEKLMYLSSAVNESSFFDAVQQMMLESEHIVFGRHGPKPKTDIEAELNDESVIYALNEEIYPFIAGISKKKPVTVGNSVWIEFTP